MYSASKLKVAIPSKKIRVGLFVDTFFPMVDGVVMVVDNYARHLSKFADVIVFTTKTRREFNDSTLPYKVIRCPMIPILFLDYDLPLPNMSKKFKEAIESSNLDIVHIHSPFGIGKMGVKYAKKHKIPVISTMHSQYKKDFLKETHNCKWLSNLLLKRVMKVFNACNECWAVNNNVAQIYYHDYGAKSLPKVHNNGTDLISLSDLTFVPNLKKELNILGDEKIFLFVGRLTRLKNIFLIVDSLKIIKEHGFKFKMIFVGSGPDEQALKNKIKNLDLVEDIFFLGKITDRHKMSQIYAISDLFLFPSLYDCSSLVQIEAASQHTPTLFVENSATAESITHNVNGYIARDNAQDYAEEILRIFQNPNQHFDVCHQAYSDLYTSWDKAIEIALGDYIKIIDKFKIIK